MKTLTLLTLSTIGLFGQAALSPPPKLQLFDANGKPLSGGYIYTYTAGTSSPLNTFTDSAASIPNTNPIVLDSAGRATVWLSGTAAYKFIVTDATGVTQYTTDGVYSSTAYLPLSGGTLTGSLLITNTVGDLGGAGNQFRDLYLSNSAKMNGTTFVDSGRNAALNNVTMSGALLTTGTSVATTTLVPVDGLATIGTVASPYPKIYATQLNVAGTTNLTGDILPAVDGSTNIGSSAFKFSTVQAMIANFGGQVASVNTAGQIRLANASGTLPFIMIGTSQGGSTSSAAIGNAAGTGAMYPINATTDLGLSGSPFRNLYVSNLFVGGGAVVPISKTVTPVLPCTLVFTNGLYVGGTC